MRPFICDQKTIKITGCGLSRSYCENNDYNNMTNDRELLEISKALDRIERSDRYIVHKNLSDAMYSTDVPSDIFEEILSCVKKKSYLFSFHNLEPLRQFGHTDVFRTSPEYIDVCVFINTSGNPSEWTSEKHKNEMCIYIMHKFKENTSGPIEVITGGYEGEFAAVSIHKGNAFPVSSCPLEKWPYRTTTLLSNPYHVYDGIELTHEQEISTYGIESGTIDIDGKDVDVDNLEVRYRTVSLGIIKSLIAYIERGDADSILGKDSKDYISAVESMKKSRTGTEKNRRAYEIRKSLESSIILGSRITYINRHEKQDGEKHGTHNSPSPHWRRGHFRRQHFGAKMEESKIIYIAPTGVCMPSIEKNTRTFKLI
jgi:hypothetical protein